MHSIFLVTPTNLNHQISTTFGRINHLKHLKQLQSFLISLGHSQTDFYAFKLIRLSVLNLSDLSYARFLFDRLHAPNIYHYTAMITAYASFPDHHPSAFALYRDMVRRACPMPNQFIFPHVLKSCEGTRLVHAQIEKLGFGGYPVVQTALVDSYARFPDNIGIARKVFDEMSVRSVVSWTAMVSGYTRVGEMEGAITLFERMPERDVPSWNAVIAGCTQNGSFSEAISIFRRMIRLAQDEGNSKNRPNQVTVVCALSACGHIGKLHLGKWIHGYVYRHCLASDSFVPNALVDMYGKCGSLKEARRVFDMTSKKSLTSWNSMINCFALHGETNNAVLVFEEMMQCGDCIRPDEITFVGLLNACVHGGLVEKGHSYFQMMTQDFGIEPQIQHYGCLIDILGRAGRFEEALEIVRSMKIEPDEVVWGSLLNGCKIYCRNDLAEFVVKKLIEIDPNNAGYGIMLANLYGELGKWDEVSKVRKMLKERNAHKTPGCSWIEVFNEVYQFYSVDKTNPRTEEIYNTLDTLAALNESGLF